MRPQKQFDSETTYPGKRWLKTIDPIRNMSISEAKAIYDAARRFGSPRLQKMYDEIEAVDPILMTCVDRRQAALSGLGYTVKALATANESLADEQRDAVQQFITGIDNFTDAIAHLELAYFRGFSHCQPIWDCASASMPTVSHINLLDNWNFLQDIDGHWLWNPNCFIAPAQCDPITPEARLVSLCLNRAIDYPALSIYIRKALGERDWGRFIERYGIPPVDVTMAANATEEQKSAYLATAEDARDGRPAVWPSGTTTNRAEGSRGQDPFTAFIEHQEKLIVLMATGGTLTSLAQADTGSLAGGAQMDVWHEIVTRDAQVISDVIKRSLIRPFIVQAFANQPLAISFELGIEKKPTAKESADLATTLKTAGYVVVQDELEEATGLTLERDTSTSSPAPFGLARRAAAKSTREDGQSATGLTDLISAFKADNKPLATAIEALLKDLETPREDGAAAHRLNQFLADLPSLLPNDPEMAAILAEEMAKQFKE